MRGEARGRDGGSESRQVAPVDAGLGVGDLVEAGHPEPVGAPTLPLVHEVPDGQDDLQHLLQTPAADQLPGGQQDGWGGEGEDSSDPYRRGQGSWSPRTPAWCHHKVQKRAASVLHSRRGRNHAHAATDQLPHTCPPPGQGPTRQTPICQITHS